VENFTRPSSTAADPPRLPSSSAKKGAHRLRVTVTCLSLAASPNGVSPELEDVEQSKKPRYQH